MSYFYEFPQHYITIRVSSFSIMVVDTDDPWIYFEIPKSFNMTAETIEKAFVELANKDWINPKTLIRLKSFVRVEYPSLHINWDNILNQIKELFRNKKIISFHIDQHQPCVDHIWEKRNHGYIFG